SDKAFGYKTAKAVFRIPSPLMETAQGVSGLYCEQSVSPDVSVFSGWLVGVQPLCLLEPPVSGALMLRLDLMASDLAVIREVFIYCLFKVASLPHFSFGNCHHLTCQTDMITWEEDISDGLPIAGSVRAALVDQRGVILAFAEQPIKKWEPQFTHHEQSSEDIWAACCFVTK
ncbi:hypothetical protein STEG23_032343, partial [Scotinomys teguina]